MEEVKIKTHLILTDITHTYNVNWCGRIAETIPKIVNGLPLFIAIGAQGRVELNTIDMRQLEECAKRLTDPKGRLALSSDTSHIYLLEENGNEALMATITHKIIRSYASMYDRVGWR